MARQDQERGIRADRSALASGRAIAPNELGAPEAYAFWHGMRDHPRTLGTSILAGFLEDIFGIKPPPFFRDRRLESIRRLTVCFRQGLADQLTIELPLARRAGVTENQIAALWSRVGRTPPASG